MRILVTGVGGFIGARVAHLLISGGHEVAGIDCFMGILYPPGVKESRVGDLVDQPGFTFARRDLRTDSIDDLLDGVDVVVHEAALPGLVPSWTSFNAYQDCNVLSTYRLLEELRRHPDAHLVHASTSSVYGRDAVGGEERPLQPVSPYGVTKLAAEHLLSAYRENFSVRSTVLRYFSVYGPGQRPDMAYAIFCDRLLRDQEILVTGNGTQSRSNTHVDDIAQATVAACEARLNGATMNVCGGDQITLNDALHILADEIGVSPRIVHGAARPGDQATTHGDWSRARSLLGWQPRIGVEQGLRGQARAAIDDFTGATLKGGGKSTPQPAQSQLATSRGVPFEGMQR